MGLLVTLGVMAGVLAVAALVARGVRWVWWQWRGRG
jgi:hypothetical protein